MKASRYCHESRMRGASELWVHADAMDSGTEVADGSSSATAEIAICTQLHSHPLQCEVPGDEGLAWGRCVLQGFPPSICIRILLSLITISCTHLIMSSYISSGHLHGFGGRTPAIQTPSSSCSQGDYCTSRRCEKPEWRDRRTGEDQTSTLPTSSNHAFNTSIMLSTLPLTSTTNLKVYNYPLSTTFLLSLSRVQRNSARIWLRVHDRRESHVMSTQDADRSATFERLSSSIPSSLSTRPAHLDH